MHIGIHLRYARCESTWIALQLASWLKFQGIKCSVLSLGKCNPKVHPDFDNLIPTDYNTPFHSWCQNKSHIIWINDISIDDVITAHHAGAKTLLITSWEDSRDVCLLYEIMDKLICLSPSLGQKLRSELQLENVHYIPLDLPLIPTRQTTVLRPDKPRILINLRGPKSHQFGSQLITTFSKWFHNIEAEWTIWVPKSLQHKKSWLHKCFKSPNKNSSFHYVSKVDWDTQRLLYGWNDLTIWPTLKGGHGLTAVLSMIMGTPVAGFDVPPANEYITKENGLLAPCQLHYDSNGLATITPDLQRYELAVTKLITQKNNLTKLKKHTADWVDRRRNLFKEGWLEVFSN